MMQCECVWEKNSFRSLHASNSLWSAQDHAEGGGVVGVELVAFDLTLDLNSDLQVGCGAIGCEMLKNYAMLGVGRKPIGLVRQKLVNVGIRRGVVL